MRDCYLSSFHTPATVPDNWSEFLDARVRLERVTVWDNHSGFGCHNLEATDCIFQFNEMNLSSSLFYANARGALLVREEATATIDNCTFTRHTGAPVIEVAESHDVLFRHCTIVDNLLIEGDPNAWPPPPTGTFLIKANRVELQNCYIADNSTTNNPHASGIVGSWIDGGGNVIGGPARLGTLRNNGGPTLSMLPLPDSPAIDAGRPSDVIVDARGLSRPSGVAPDAGAIEVGAAPLADTDRDGLPDNWELFHGLNPTNATDAASDADADGRVALAEFQSRTDPADAQSVLRIENFQRFSFGSSTPIVRFRWPRVPGVTYQVETSTDLRQWQKARGNIWTASYTTTAGVRVSEFDGPADSSALFYRVTVIDY